MRGELGGKLVEVLSQLNLTAQRPERRGDGMATLHGYELGDGMARALDDDLLAALGKVDQPR